MRIGNHRSALLAERRTIRLRQVAPFMAAAVVVGAVVLAVTFAASPPAAFEPEDGVKTSGATDQTLAGASGGSVLKFNAPALTPTPAPQTGFVHPGVLVDKSQLDFVKAKIDAGAEPWTSAFNKAKGNRLGKTTYTAAPVATIDCTADPTGCEREHDDAIAAYTQALLWYYTGDRSYAQNSARIMNAWASTMSASSGNQAHLNQAWSGETISRAAELIRYTYTPAAGEVVFNVPQFTSMLTNVVMPQIIVNTAQSNNSAGNWELSMTEGQINIAIFTDDHALFDAAIDRWRARTRSYIYLTSDGPKPNPIPGTYMNDPARFKCIWSLSVDSKTCTIPPNFQYMNGQSVETCRDISHVILGMEAMVYTAETARIQGVDLYGQEQERIVAGYEFNARYDAATLDGGAIPATLCSGQPLNLGGSGYTLGWQVAYNEYAGRKGVTMPYTKAMMDRFRPSSAVLHMDFETLTHGTP